MIRLAQRRDHPRLKALWAQVFGDAPREVDAYFAQRHRDEDMLVWADEDGIQGMLSMLPITLTAGGAAYPARYIYAVATAPARRGHGIATLLLDRAGEMIRARQEAAAVLAPASESLFGYYAQRGYHAAFFQNVADFTPQALPISPAGGQVLPCASEAYTRIRDAAFTPRGLYARWDQKAVGYALSALGGDGAALLRLGDGEGVAAFSPMENGVLVRELALVGIEVPQALAMLHGRLGAALYRVRLAAGSQPGAADTPSGMIRWFVPEPLIQGPGYLALTLD